MASPIQIRRRAKKWAWNSSASKWSVKWTAVPLGVLNRNMLTFAAPDHNAPRAPYTLEMAGSSLCARNYYGLWDLSVLVLRARDAGFALGLARRVFSREIIAAVCLVRLKRAVNLPARAEWDETVLQFRSLRWLTICGYQELWCEFNESREAS